MMMQWWQCAKFTHTYTLNTIMVVRVCVCEKARKEPTLTPYHNSFIIKCLMRCWLTGLACYFFFSLSFIIHSFMLKSIKEWAGLKYNIYYFIHSILNLNLKIWKRLCHSLCYVISLWGDQYRSNKQTQDLCLLITPSSFFSREGGNWIV